jgi:hypothetical protein
MAVLKEELFALETERLQGKVADPEYTAAKNALELTLRRALQRNELKTAKSAVADPVVTQETA